MKYILYTLLIAGILYLIYRYFVFGYGSSYNYESNPLKPTNMFGFGTPETYDNLTNEYTY